MTSDDISCYLMTSDVLVLHYIQLVVKIFYGVVEKVASKLSVSEFLCLFVNFQFFELIAHSFLIQSNSESRYTIKYHELN